MAVSTYPNQRNRVRRILGALLLAVMLILAAYFVSNPNLFSPQVADAESTQALLEAFAQQKGPDGKPLWEDELIATSSSTPVIVASSTGEIISSSTPDAAPDTLTDQFAQNLFEQYVSQLGSSDTDPSDDDLDTFAQNAISSVVQDHSQQDAYTSADETVEGSGPAALTVYAAAASQAFNETTFNSDDNEIDYFSDVVEKNDLYELKTLADIGQAYTNLAPTLMQVPVPVEAQYAQLEIANAAARLGEDITDMSMYETDPLRAYLGLNAWQTDAPAFAKGFSDMNTVFENENVTIPQGNSGYLFYSLLLAAGPAATTTSP